MADKTIKVNTAHKDLSWVLLAPRITEKAAMAGLNRAYTFNVSTDATKTQVKKAIELTYGVIPQKVRMIQIPRKNVRRGYQTGTTKKGKKAIVTLKEGDTIEFA